MGKARWVKEDLWYLLNAPMSLLQEMYPEYSVQTLKGKRAYWKQKLEKGYIKMPEAPQKPPEGMQYTPEQINEITKLLERSGITPDNIQHISKVNIWQGFIKNEDGEIETTDLYSVQYVPTEEERSYLSQADPVKISPTRIKARKNKEQLAVILPDMQAPYEDPKALDVAYQIIKDLQPNEVIMNGDNLDFDLLSRFIGDGGVESLNESITRVHQIMATIRANAPDARITWLEGNHELRLRKTLMQNAKELLGIRQAATGHNVLSIPFLLNLADLDIDYVSGYPANQYWVHNNLRVIHGNVVRSGGSTAAAIAKNSDVSTIFGHVHRREMYSRTVNSYNIGKVITAASFGCLSKVTGEVPSYHSGKTEDGEPVQHFENWTQGIGVVSWQNNSHDIQQINIDTFNEYRTRYNGKIYLPND